METKKKLENFYTIGYKNGCFNLIHRRGYRTTARFNDKDYTFFIAKGKKGVEPVIGENPRFYYAYEASTGMRVCGLGSDTIEAACGYIFSDSFTKAFTKLIQSGKIEELQNRFQQTLKMERKDIENECT